MSIAIVVDNHEPLDISEELARQLTTTRANLVGTGYCDYLWFAGDGHSITVERKEVHDLAGRVDVLEGQLKRGLVKADEVILLVEGVYEPIEGGAIMYRQKHDGSIFYKERCMGRPYAYYQSFFWKLDKMGVSTFHTSSKKGTAYALAEFVKASQDAQYQTFNRYIRDKPRIISLDPQVKLLMGLGLGEVRAKAMIAKYGDVWTVLQQSVDELCSVEGIGKKTAEGLLKGVGKP